MTHRLNSMSLRLSLCILSISLITSSGKWGLQLFRRINWTQNSMIKYYFFTHSLINNKNIIIIICDVAFPVTDKKRIIQSFAFCVYCWLTWWFQIFSCPTEKDILCLLAWTFPFCFFNTAIFRPFNKFLSNKILSKIITLTWDLKFGAVLARRQSYC